MTNSLDAEGIKACSRWLSRATPPDTSVKNESTPAGVPRRRQGYSKTLGVACVFPERTCLLLRVWAGFYALPSLLLAKSGRKNRLQNNQRAGLFLRLRRKAASKVIHNLIVQRLAPRAPALGSSQLFHTTAQTFEAQDFCRTF